MTATRRRRERTPSIRWEQLIPERQDLISDNLGLIGGAMAKYRTSYPALSQEEAEDACRLGLVLAAKKWREERGVKFTTYAYRSMLNHLIRQSQLAVKQKAIRVTVTIGEDGIDVADTRNHGERGEAMILAERLIRVRLKKRESVKSIARNLGLREETVRRVARAG